MNSKVFWKLARISSPAITGASRKLLQQIDLFVPQIQSRAYSSLVHSSTVGGHLVCSISKRSLSFAVSCPSIVFSARRFINTSVITMGCNNSKDSNMDNSGSHSNPLHDSAGATPAADQSEFIETVVAKTSDVPEGQMLEVNVGDEGQALLVHQNGKYTAIGHKCTHYGAPLVKGCLGDGRVRCPWHGACFNVETGDIEDYPGLDNVARYDVRVDGDDVVIKANKKLLKAGRTPVKISSTGSMEDKTVVIVGGGPASVVCIETLRQEGYKGNIILCCREDTLPYDRPKLSKAMHLTASDIALKPKTFYDDMNVDLKLGKQVTKVNLSEKAVILSDESKVNYSILLLATGGVPRCLPVPGFKEYVHLLREPAQANTIAAEARDKKVVIIGTSFIGMEVAAYLSDKASSVDCIGISAVPFERVLGTRVGKALQQMFEEKGVRFHLQAGVKEIVAENGKVTGVTLPSDSTLPADIVIAGVGVAPSTDFLKDSGLPMSKRGEVIVDEHMRAMEDVFAAGDIAQFPLPLIGDNVSIGHWQIAHNHGRVAARNMVGKVEQFNSIPYFWTVLFGKSLRYCGFALEWDEILFDGNPEELKFAAYFAKGEKILAACSLGMDPAVSATAELMYQGKMPNLSQLKSNIDVRSYLK